MLKLMYNLNGKWNAVLTEGLHTLCRKEHLDSVEQFTEVVKTQLKQQHNIDIVEWREIE